MKTIKILILTVVIAFVFTQCQEVIHPSLEKDKYEVVDTLYRRINGFSKVTGRDVIILLKSDSSYRYGYIKHTGDLIRVGVEPIDLKK